MEKRIERVSTAIGTIKTVVLADEQQGIFISVNPLTRAWMQKICDSVKEDLPEIVNGYYHFAYPEYLSCNIYPYSAKKYREQLGSVSKKFNKTELQVDYWESMLDYLDDDVPVYYDEFDKVLYTYLYNESLRGSRSLYLD